MEKGEGQERKDKVSKRNVSLLAAIFNLTKSAVGVGTLFLHGKLVTLGFTAGLVAIMTAALMSTLSLHLLSRMAHNCDTGDYFVLGRQALGPHGERIIVIALLLFLFAGLVYYCLFVESYVQQTLEYVLQQPNYKNVILTTVVPVLLFMFPLSCLRDLSALAVSSIVGMLSIMGVTGLVVFHYLTSPASENTKTLTQALASESVIGPAGWSAFGGIIFAFVNHFTVVSLCQVLQRPTPTRRCILNIASTVASLAIYIPCAIFGYLLFSKEPTILDVKSNILFAIARGVVVLVIMVSFPLLLDPARSSLNSMLPFPDSTARHFGVTFLLTVLPLVTVLSFGWKVDDFLSLLSAICGSFLVFIAPPVFFLRLQSKMVVHGWERVGAYVLFAFGLIVLATGTYSTASKLLHFNF